MSQEKFGKTGINPNRKLRKVVGASVYILFLLSTCVGIVGLAILIFDVLDKGIPCISSDCSGSSDILLNGKIGIIYKKNDKNHLIQSMIKMHKRYNNFRINSLKYMSTSNRFLITPQAQKYLNFLSKFIL